MYVCLSVQELEIVMGDEHISFTTTKIGSLLDCKNSRYEVLLRVTAAALSSLLQGRGRTEDILLPRAGPEMPCVQFDWTALQDQANLNYYCSDSSAPTLSAINTLISTTVVIAKEQLIIVA